MVLDSRGLPTVRVELRTGDEWVAATAPSGASTGSREALERRDGGADWMGKGVDGVVASLREEVLPGVVGRDPGEQREADGWLIALDGTPQKGRLGANALLPVSLAIARAAAVERGLPLWGWIAVLSGTEPALPVPTLNVLNGGAHADNGLDVQEFMLVPRGPDFVSSLRAAVETYHSLKGGLASAGLSTALGDEGGFAPRLAANGEGLAWLRRAAARAGYSLGEEMGFAVDVAASELQVDGGYRWEGATVSAGDLAAVYEGWLEEGGLVSVEDGMAEDDEAGWALLAERLSGRVTLIGDDLLVTDPARVEWASGLGLCDGLLVKVNQIGTLSETLDAVAAAREAGWSWSVSHRSGETEDDFIADLAVGTGAPFIKTGAPARGERTAKYNRLLAIVEEGPGLPWRLP